MTFHSDKRAPPEIFSVLFQYQHDIFADALWPDIVKPKLDDAGQSGARLKKQFCEIKVMRENDGIIFYGPLHDVRVRRIGRAKFPPVTGGVSVLAQIFNPRKRKTIVNDDGHAG